MRFYTINALLSRGNVQLKFKKLLLAKSIKKIIIHNSPALN